MVTESEILNCISDDKCREILALIAQGKPITTPISRLSRKQFYSRLHSLRMCDLIRKENGKYRLTSFGKVVFELQLVLMKIITEDFWKFKALDVIDTSDIPNSERTKLFETLGGEGLYRHVGRREEVG